MIRCTAYGLLSAIVAALCFFSVAGSSRGNATTSLLRIAALPIDQTSDVFVAQDEGFFNKAGLNVHITVLNSGPAIIGAVSGGSADIGNANPGSVAQARERGIALRFIAPAGLHVSSVPVDMLMVPRDSPIRSVADLAGKTVAVNALNALPNIATKAWIARNGGDIRKVNFVELPFPIMGEALTTGRVDAAEMTEPFITSSKRSIRALADVFNGIGKRFIVSGWFATDGWIDANPDEAGRFATAMQRAHAWANAHQKESAKILVRHTTISASTAASMERVVFGSRLDGALIQPVLTTFSEFGGLPEPLDASKIIWSGPARPASAQ